MEIIEILTVYGNKSENILSVEFQVLNDEESRSDIIDYNVVEEFGDDIEMNLDVFEDYDTDYDELETWDNDDNEVFIDNETLITFLNEYYIIFPDRIPEEE